jgi:hypothetical protein
MEAFLHSININKEFQKIWDLIGIEKQNLYELLIKCENEDDYTNMLSFWQKYEIVFGRDYFFKSHTGNLPNCYNPYQYNSTIKIQLLFIFQEGLARKQNQAKKKDEKQKKTKSNQFEIEPQNMREKRRKYNSSIRQITDINEFDNL